MSDDQEDRLPSDVETDSAYDDTTIIVRTKAKSFRPCNSGNIAFRKSQTSSRPSDAESIPVVTSVLPDRHTIMYHNVHRVITTKHHRIIPTQVTMPIVGSRRVREPSDNIEHTTVVDHSRLRSISPEQSNIHDDDQGRDSISGRMISLTLGNDREHIQNGLPGSRLISRSPDTASDRCCDSLASLTINTSTCRPWRYISDKVLSSIYSELPPVGEYVDHASDDSSNDNSDVDVQQAYDVPDCIDNSQSEDEDMSMVCDASLAIDACLSDAIAMAEIEYGSLLGDEYAFIPAVEYEPTPFEGYFIQDLDGDNPFMLAIIHKMRSCVDEIIDEVNDPHCLDLQNKLWQTGLHLAVLVNDPHVVKRIVQKGARLDIRNASGNTALHLACANGYLACVKQITSVIIHDDDVASAKQSQSTQHCIPSRDLFTLMNYEGYSCLHLACIKGHCDVIEYLVTNQNVDVNIRDGTSGRTILHHAIERSNDKLFSILLSQDDLDIYTHTFSGDTAIQLAVGRQEDEMFNRLLLFGEKCIR